MSTTTRKLMGLVFSPMTDNDWDAFAGANEGSLICYCDDEETVLIYDPNEETITEMLFNEEDVDTNTRIWKLTAEI